MTRRASRNASRGAVATGAGAVGAASLGAMALGALALGAVAVGALGIGRLGVGRARLRRVEIGELSVGRLEIGGADSGERLTGVAQVRAMPGEGDALERLLRDHRDGGGAAIMAWRASRSRADPDLFLFHGTCADETGWREALDAVLSRAAREGLVASGATLETDLFRAI